jgi:hypothetical protein
MTPITASGAQPASAAPARRTGRARSAAAPPLARRLELDGLADKLKDLHNASYKPDDSPSEKLRAGEENLVGCAARYEEDHRVQKTYEQVIRRLKQERLSFPAEQKSLEGTLKQKESEYEQLLLMSHDANLSKEVAKTELSKFELIVSEERKLREKELQQRRQLLHKKQQLATELEKNERERRAALQEPTGRAGEDAARAQAEETQRMIEQEQQKIEAYEGAFNQIKEATGVVDVNEVIQKFLTQEQTHENLVNLTKEAQARIEQLAEERVSTKTMVDEMKYAGGTGQGSRAEVEAMERKHTEQAQALERAKTRQLRMMKVFIDIRVGIEHLADKLEPVKLDTAPVPVSDDTIVDVMLQSESKLTKLFDAAASLPEQELDRPTTVRSDSGNDTGFNVRVALADNEEDDDDDEEEGVEPEIPDRAMMKKMHGMMLDKANAKGKKKRRKFAADAEKPQAPKGKPAAGTGYNAAGSRSVGRRGDIE